MKVGAYVIKIPRGYFYFGSTKNFDQRYQQHRYELNHGLHRVSLLQLNFFPGDKIEYEFYPTNTRDEAYELERQLIQRHWGNPLLCNQTDCVKPGEYLTPERRKQFAEGRKGVPLTEEEKAKISAAKMGGKHSPETIAKMSATRKGRRLCDTAQNNSREAIRVSVVINGRVFESLTDAAKFHGCNASVVRYRVESQRPKWKDWRKN